MKRTPGAMVVAMIALFVALSGVAVASTTGLINGAQIKDHTISIAKLTPGAVAVLHGQKGPKGDPGSAGTQGAQGPPGGFDPNKVTYVQGPQVSVDPFTVTGQAVTLTATCPAGAKALGGGGFNSITTIAASFASSDGASWNMIIINESSITVPGLFAFAVCGTK